MRTTGELAAGLVTAAQAGDQQALQALVERSLPLVYNIVGRALDGHADVDDVVQETLLRVVNNLSELREPDRFRSWLVAIAIRQVRDRWRLRQARPLSELPDEAADPGADFVDLSILQLGLSGQRREVAEATRWLEPEERQLLSLWWLEAADELTRAELAEASGLTPQHAAVRVQRMKARLDSARAVVRALQTRPRCPELRSAAADWNGAPSALWRKRLARHTRECPDCAGHWVNLLPAEGLLVGLTLVPPLGLAVSAVLGAASGTGASGGAPAGIGLMDRLVQGAQGLWAKPVALAAAGAVTAAGGAAVLYPVTRDPQAAPRPNPPAVISSTAPTTTRPQPTTATPHHPSPPPSAISTPRFRYGQTVDTADSAPPRNKRAGTLPARPQGPAVTMNGVFDTRSPDGGFMLVHRGEHLTITGRGYFRIRWQVMFTERPGHLQMPSWTGLDGRLFHVASGGGYRLDDQQPDQPGKSWMGNPTQGHTVLPAGAQQMWQNEFYYLDGAVTLNQNETGADYNLQLLPMTRAEVVDDLNQPPSASSLPVRYGLVRDTGRNDAPLPQYVTRSTPAEPRSVPQRSDVS